jgi:predicted NodU family carbamoyl transferase
MEQLTPHTESIESSPHYWKLIRELEKLTDIPVLLNTPFNIQEPVV